MVKPSCFINKITLLYCFQ
uniref:Uncharacterized protein n=1 Tax=Anguilla anguilla TaxID=7936 RepID=A0A0E9PA99_ANGAN